MKRRCTKCGWSGQSNSVFAYGYFPAAAAFLFGGATVIQAASDIHPILDGAMFVGLIGAVFSIPALARRFDACPECKEREWETTAES